MLLDYLIAAAIIFPVLLDNTVHQNIEKKILNFFFWILLGLPILFTFFFKFNFFLNNILIFIFFLIINTTLLVLYFDKIKNILNSKKSKKYHKNKELNFNLIAIYFIFLLIQLILFF